MLLSNPHRMTLLPLINVEITSVVPDVFHGSRHCHVGCVPQSQVMLGGVPQSTVTGDGGWVPQSTGTGDVGWGATVHSHR